MQVFRPPHQALCFVKTTAPPSTICLAQTHLFNVPILLVKLHLTAGHSCVSTSPPISLVELWRLGGPESHTYQAGALDQYVAVTSPI